MARNPRHRKPSADSEDETIAVKRENESKAAVQDEIISTNNGTKDEPISRSATPLSLSARVKPNTSSSSTPRYKTEGEESPVKLEVEQSDSNISSNMASKASKKMMRGSKKNPPRIAPLFYDLPDATDEANSTYTVIDSCLYQNKYLGFTEHAMECDCQEEWGRFYRNCGRNTRLLTIRRLID